MYKNTHISGDNLLPVLIVIVKLIWIKSCHDEQVQKRCLNTLTSNGTIDKKECE